MSNLSIHRQMTNEGVLRLAITGEVDLDTAGLLTGAISNVISAGHIGELIVDLDQVTFLDAAGISSLIRGHNLALAFGVTCLVTNPHGLAYRVLDITGVLRLLTERPRPSELP